MTVATPSPAIPVTRTTSARPRPAEDQLGFGKYFADHMLLLDYTKAEGWHAPRVVPYGPLDLEPAAAGLHYGQAMFEGLKAYRLADGRVSLFRLDRHAARMAAGAVRLSIPPVDEALFMQGVTQLVSVDRDWVPTQRGTALYIRPTIVASEPFLGVRAAERYTFFVITSPVGAYYTGGMRPVKIWIERERVRAVRGGIGATKAAANYVASLQVAEQARAKGCDQVLWLDAVEHRWLEEVGTMNLFLLVGDELVTPPLGGSILAGVTRDTVLALAHEWGLTVSERMISMDEVKQAHADGRLKEIFGSGTAAVIQAVGTLVDEGREITINGGLPGPLAQRLYDAITRLQYGEEPDTRGWQTLV